MVLPYLESFYSGLWQVLMLWWWLILPIVFYFPVKFIYLWWIQWEVWYNEQEWVILEVLPPAEVQKPFRAMEDIFMALWPIYDSANWREIWCEGEFDSAPFWLSVEAVSLEGEIHFYFRMLKSHRRLFESVVHAHYPDAEIFEVEDYTQKVPQDLPNQEYDVYGEDYVFIKREHAYPIKTYKFFEIKPEEIDPEKKLDPLSALLEGMARLKKGEQFWFQIVAAPITDNEVPWITEGKKLVNKLASRKEDPKQPSIAGEAFRYMAYSDIPFSGTETEEKPFIPPEMKLTPGEREIISAVEEKISKHGFKTFIRAVYVYKKDAYVASHRTLARSYFLHFATQHLNAIRFMGDTRTKIHYAFRQRRLLTRKKKMFRKYIKRLPPFYPKMTEAGHMVLNAEELATIFHFPMSTVGLPPGVPRILAKKGGPPPGIPTE